MESSIALAISLFANIIIAGFTIWAVFVSRTANRKADTSNTISTKSNELSHKANKMAESSNRIAEIMLDKEIREERRSKIREVKKLTLEGHLQGKKVLLESIDLKRYVDQLDLSSIDDPVLDEIASNEFEEAILEVVAPIDELEKAYKYISSINMEKIIVEWSGDDETKIESARTLSAEVISRCGISLIRNQIVEKKIARYLMHNQIELLS